jgi:hypothetical protein
MRLRPPASVNQGVAITTGYGPLSCSARRLSLMGIHRQASALPRPRPGLSGSMGIHRSWAPGRTCTRSGVRLSDTDTRVVPPRFLLDGYPSQNAAPASIRLEAARMGRDLQVEDSATLALHPCQTAAAHLPCTRPPDLWRRLGRPRARSRPDGSQARAAARAFALTRSGFDTRMSRHDQDALTEVEDTAGAAFDRAPARGPRNSGPPFMWTVQHLLA